jgi:hypothetical protein
MRDTSVRDWRYVNKFMSFQESTPHWILRCAGSLVRPEAGKGFA